MANGRRYEQLSAKAYEHPADRAATSALHAIPLMDKVIKRLTDVALERRLNQILLGNAVRIGDQQVPSLWSSFIDCAASLDLERRPDLYVTQTPFANALTIGAHTPVVIIYSGLANDYANDEVEAVLAHELGHVLSEHYYYTTAFVLLAQFLQTSVPSGLAGLPIRAIYYVLLEWSRAAELSSDRASALVMGDPLVDVPDAHAHGRRLARGHEPRCLHHPGQRVRRRGGPLRPLVASMGGDRPLASLRRQAYQGADRVGGVRGVRPHPRRQLRAPGPRAAGDRRSSRRRWRTTARGSQGCSSARREGSSDSSGRWRSGCRPLERDRTTRATTRTAQHPEPSHSSERPVAPACRLAAKSPGC